MRLTTSKNYSIEYLGQKILVRCFVSFILNNIENIFKYVLTKNTDKEPLLKVYSIDFHSDGTSIVVMNDEDILHIQKNACTVEVTNVLMNLIKLDLLSAVKSSIVLHAGLVSLDEKSILLPGKSGAGKSLITLGLLSLGYKYHTDEVVSLNLDDNTITPFVRPVMIKSHGLDAAKSLLGEEIESLIVEGESTSSILIEDLYELFNKDISDTCTNKNYSLHKPPPIHFIVFPEYDAISSGEIIVMTPAQTMIELFKSNVIARNFPDLGASSLKKIVQQSKGFKLRYGSYDQLPKLFQGISQ